ncbi:hypothetical protein CcCBS67573_g04281 [Chytriomyces confervae]|uniref:DNA-directed RNA polymerase I subunit RPA12 n=1 Tax=Chytriomyces confervae TaxID=246404 RepID=A0A507FFD1_9FUNG|nr:hypothetical protein CcCBS67573_g04281 [Chytriomyces confervae]
MHTVPVVLIHVLLPLFIFALVFRSTASAANALERREWTREGHGRDRVSSFKRAGIAATDSAMAQATLTALSLEQLHRLSATLNTPSSSVQTAARSSIHPPPQKLLCNAISFDSLEVVTQSSVTAFTTRPMPKKKNTGDEDSMAHLRDGATIKERCPKCDAPEMVFHTAQLRSADEGQTVFYSCVKCGFKEKLNS